MASVKAKRKGLCASVIGVLHQFLQYRESAPVAIT
jgi:hypothetical protein